MPFCNKIGKFQDVQCGLIHLLSNLNIAVPVPLKRVDLGEFIFDVYGLCLIIYLSTFHTEAQLSLSSYVLNSLTPRCDQFVLKLSRI